MRVRDFLDFGVGMCRSKIRCKRPCGISMEVEDLVKGDLGPRCLVDPQSRINLP